MDGFRIREIREASGLLQVEVAMELGICQETLCRWEKSGKEVSKMAQEAFLRLTQDQERTAQIRKNRRQRRKEKNALKS